MNWKALFVVALVSVLSGPISASTSSDAGVTLKEWRFICSNLRDMGYNKVDCRKINRPTVILTDAVEDLAQPGFVLYGLTYDGEDQVLINPNMDPVFTRTIIVHETVHYVLYQFYGKGVTECTSEDAARIVHHKWEGTEYDDEWKSYYGC